ncbi:Detected protein of confused Function [Hibiscus syriacus]|uniref:Detected protein of confused Function n=1 Tax=Hibiscus syriacus TaxID=106335 RepID=A0A6A3BD94_HIBSY|nr:Detected protein of confused Function [Hibiscus syriacus]
MSSAAAPIVPTPPMPSKAKASSSSSHCLSPLLDLLSTSTSTSRTQFGSSALARNSMCDPRILGRRLDADEEESTPQAKAPQSTVKYASAPWPPDNHTKEAARAAESFTLFIAAARETCPKLADKVAAAGFYVVVPDFFYGEPFISDNPDRPLPAWLKDHPPAKGFEDAKLIIAALRSKGISSIRAAGFCWGEGCPYPSSRTVTSHSCDRG